ncbi:MULTISPECIES: DUF1090 domain-containing protein [Pseudomonadaceae]|uniref:DUF1090 domain-containing protein n=1 Tax=Pseudomonas denitrificans TaxID=43306 RepID=A0A9X7N2S8_PSEDE|nr:MULTISPECIES: DUF1090 domain-containing protein [Pseudomonadaceae]MBD9515507.1 DUF1090 domain-containing protein [Pseudomonas sp. PDM22]MBD9633217.1 DUF1090 domain-containing protein [Pseudomonas sp. PDM19]OQR38250.1 hypothetical protein BWR15_01690 [Pseudomonas sp. T]QEY73998.1 DUF1090 domain-containing protein [Pseudomonas denitrificans (nom. rej.)]
MFRSSALMAAVLALGCANPLFAADAAKQPLTGCAAKRAAIETQLEQAKAQGNGNRVAGLQTALEKVKTYCTDASLTQERKQNVLDAEKEVAQREKDLRKAMNKGDAEKIEKRKDKLAEARAELEQAKRELEE